MRLSEIKGIGSKTEALLANEGIISIKDLLYAFPKTYTLYELNHDLLFKGEYTTIEGNLDSSPAFIKYRKSVNAVIFYILINNIKLKCLYFSSDYLRYKLHKGTKVQLYGKYKNDTKEFLVKKIFFDDFTSKVDVDYKIKGVTNTLIKKAVKALFVNNISIEETLPDDIKDKYKLYDIAKYIYTSHFPQNKTEIKQILRRRKYEEFFWYAIRLELLKQSRKEDIKTLRSIDDNLLECFLDSLPYELTSDQVATMNQIKHDILDIHPMNRLVQGDVGCGKSIVALYAALLTISAGYQAVMMVPTEILANQQFEAASKLFNRLGIQVALLTSSVKKKDKEDILYRLTNNRISLIIGTHALLEERVIFNRLGIVIIDEQHKFGVNQRQRLIDKFQNVDALYLTATPIPRTLGLTVFGDLDISSIKTMPNGRKSINTKTISYTKISSLMKFIDVRIKDNEQVYVVVPLVEDNDEIDAISINEAYDMFKSALPNINIGMVHGKMSSLDKNNIMSEFKRGNIKILISTTVIEVGVNVPNATVMVIMDSDRFGLAQIHQLRGRVGRSNLQAYCALVTKDILNPRLNILESTTDGFEIAEEDFKLRGPGDYLGNIQSGLVSLSYADFQTDLEIWKCAKEDALIYLPKFADNNIKNSVFDSIIIDNKNKKSKIN